MILFKKAADLHKYIANQREKGNTTGFVPTMGALHPGHISLISEAKKENDLVVCSIFVNPTQFNDPKDFEKYPITIEKDITLLEAAGCHLLFLPGVAEIYTDGMKPRMHYDLGFLETRLEGPFRPGHFQGVCMVVHRLLDIVQPGRLYLGQKDYQQCMVISRLIEIMGMSEKIQVRICPTLRETDGLAMSSRNTRLNEEERNTAAVIYQTLLYIKQSIRPGDISFLQQEALNRLEKAGFKPDYADIADANTLAPVTCWDGKQPMVALIAAFLNQVRLIDNLVIS